MNAQCPKCFFIVPLDAGRYPPWCKKCGVDLKPHDYIPVAAQPVELPPEPEPEIVRVHVQPIIVTGTGPKNWLRGGAGVTGTVATRPAPAAAPLAAKPVPAVTPEEEAPIGILHVAGIVLLLIAGVMAGNVWTANKNFGEATGEVKMTDVKGGLGTIFHTRRIQYVVNGVTYDCDPKNYDLDETVSLLYEVNDPLKVQVGSKVSRYGWAVMVAVCGLGLLGVGVLRANSHQRERERNAPKPDF
jgi:hypothetical protein